MSSIVILDAYTMNPGDLSWETLRSLGDLTIYDRTRKDQIVERAKSAEIILSNKALLDQSILEQLPDLKCICVTATGYNNVDVAFANSKGISVSNVVGYAAPAVAQHVFAMVLSMTNQFKQHSDGVRSGKWSTAKDWCYWDSPIMELAGKTLGILGFGKIGQQVAKIAMAFDMNIIAHHKYPKRDKMEAVQFVTIDTLFKKSDILSLHAPLNDETKEIINLANLSKMKTSSILVNTGRGGLVNESDLCKALEEGKIAGACLDVLSQEPPKATNVLLNAPNCMISPHQAWASLESRQRLLDGVIENVKAYLSGNPRNVGR